jgi:hypothetical protein
MTDTKNLSRSVVFRKASLAIIAITLLILACTVVVPPAYAHKNRHFQKLSGIVNGNGSPQSGYAVSLYASYLGGIPFNWVVGTDTTDGGGSFEIEYRLPPGLSSRHKLVLYLLAEKDKAMLASAIHPISRNDSVVVNELTTVATGTAFAQFIDGRRIQGNRFGMRNAVKMAANMANPKTGAIGEVLDNSPNADETSTRRTFFSLANIVASCVEDKAHCAELFEFATPIGGPEPTTVLQALANMTKFPSDQTLTGFSGLFSLSLLDEVYGPALRTKPTSWLLFIKFTGAFSSDFNPNNLMSGPGQIAFDRRGFAWINDNYVPSVFDPNSVTNMPDAPNLDEIGCAGLRVFKFYPWGEPVPGVPFFGGGLSGAGFGITINPQGKIWVGNFGFESPLCAGGTVPADPANKIPATHDSASLFRTNGTPISVSYGITEGHIWWPQGTVSDKSGNIWMGNCGNDTVTLIPRGKPSQAKNIAIPGGLGARNIFHPRPVDSTTSLFRPRIKPFGVAIDTQERAWVTGNSVGFDRTTQPSDYVGGVYRISKDGTVKTMAVPTDELVSWPMGISSDSKGNMWVSSSDHVNVPCVTPFEPDQGGALGPAVTYFPADDGTPQVFGKDPGNSGGITIPWGNFVDGNDTVWILNFGTLPFANVDVEWPDTPLSHFCGADTSKCPAGFKLGDPISPPTGYVTDALDRVTGGGVDRSGNIWILNNWKRSGPFNPVYIRNPGGNSFVIVPGAAAPVKTPLIGPPQSFNK